MTIFLRKDELVGIFDKKFYTLDTKNLWIIIAKGVKHHVKNQCRSRNGKSS